MDVFERVVDAAQLAVLPLSRDKVLGLVVLAYHDNTNRGETSQTR